MIEFLNIQPGFFVTFRLNGFMKVGRVVMRMQGKKHDDCLVADKDGKTYSVPVNMCQLHRVASANNVFDRYGGEVSAENVFSV